MNHPNRATNVELDFLPRCSSCCCCNGSTEPPILSARRLRATQRQPAASARGRLQQASAFATGDPARETNFGSRQPSRLAYVETTPIMVFLLAGSSSDVKRSPLMKLHSQTEVKYLELHDISWHYRRFADDDARAHVAGHHMSSSWCYHGLKKRPARLQKEMLVGPTSFRRKCINGPTGTER